MMRRLIAAGIKLREPTWTPIDIAMCLVIDIDPGLETRLHGKTQTVFLDCIRLGLMDMKPTSPLTGIVFFPRLLPDRERAGPFGKELLIHKRDGSVFVGLHMCLRAWRAADISGKVESLRENIAASIGRIRPKRLFDSDRASLLAVVESAVEPAVMAVRREFPNVA